VQRLDAGQIDLGNLAQSAPHKGKLGEVDAIDLDLAGGQVAIIQQHFGRLARPDRGQFRQADRLPQQRRNRLPGVREAVLDQAVLLDGFGDASQAVLDLAQDVDGRPFVGAVRGLAGGLVDRPVGRHLAEQLARRVRLASHETAVAGDVPEAVQQFAVGIAERVLLSGRGGVVVAAEFQQSAEANSAARSCEHRCQARMALLLVIQRPAALRAALSSDVIPSRYSSSVVIHCSRQRCPAGVS